MTLETNSAKGLFKSFALSFFIVSIAFLLIIGSIGVFTIYAGRQFGEFLKNIPFNYTLVYAGLITALTWIKKKYN